MFMEKLFMIPHGRAMCSHTTLTHLHTSSSTPLAWNAQHRYTHTHTQNEIRNQNPIRFGYASFARHSGFSTARKQRYNSRAVYPYDDDDGMDALIKKSHI